MSRRDPPRIIRIARVKIKRFIPHRHIHQEPFSCTPPPPLI
jgi:hypothetical protein